MAVKWEPTAFKDQLRLTSQRLGQLQERMDSKSTITKKEVATLLQQDNVPLARAKAGILVQDDAMSDLLEVLEMHIGIILEQLSEIDHSASLSQGMLEAASSIIYAAPMTESKELNQVRDVLIQRLGPDFTHSAIVNRDGHVSRKVVRALAAPPPSAAKLDSYLHEIARGHGVNWTPEPQRQDIVDALSELLDPKATPVVDLPRLRKLCSLGIPDEPRWLRPRIWKLFLGILPTLKTSWGLEIGKQRESYYDLVRRLLPPIGLLPLPSEPPRPQDKLLLDVSTQLSRIPQSLFDGLEAELEITAPGPLHDTAPDEVKISCVGVLDARLGMLRKSRHSTHDSRSDIQIDIEEVAPEISISSPTDEKAKKATTLLARKTHHMGNAHPQHLSALHRLLFLHASINPGNLSPHIPSLLVPLYTIVIQEVEPENLAHTEADTFWLFETIIGEFSELEDEDGGSIWMKKLSQRLQWADSELWDSLNIRGLDPALPHYSYRWLAPLLSHTIPFSSVILVWDVLFTQNPRERDQNHKLEYLIDVCTAMLVRAKIPLQRLGKSGRKSPSMWGEAGEALPPPSPLRSWEMGEAFLEGTTLLQLYPLEATGGIERILQTANDLAQRREDENKRVPAQQMTLGERLKVTMWKGFTNQAASPIASPEGSDSSEEEDVMEEDSKDDGNDTETPATVAAASSELGLGSRLANTVWRGITNQSSMDPPPSPLPSPLLPPPRPPQSTPSISIEEVSTPMSNQKSAFWSYAEKLRDSDTAAALAKVSTNWRAKAMIGAWGAKIGESSQPPQELSPPTHKGTSSESYNTSTPSKQTERRTSLPGPNSSSTYSPPPRPAYFRPPRDSWLPPMPVSIDLSSPPQPSEPLEGQSLINKAKNLSWNSLKTSAPEEAPRPSPKSAPKPLLLGSTPVVGSSRKPPISRSHSNSTLDNQEWEEIMSSKKKALHRGSRSSMGSLSPSDAITRIRQEDSDTTSRVVPLNRRSISPMAPPRLLDKRMSGYSSPASSDRGSVASPDQGRPRSRAASGWGQVAFPDSPPAASSGPGTPHVTSPTAGPIKIKDTEPQRGSVVLNELEPLPLVPPQPKPKLTRKKTPPPGQLRERDSEDSSAIEITGLRRTRTKKYPPRLASLQIQDSPRLMKTVVEQKTTSPNSSLAVEWPNEDSDLGTTPKASNFENNDGTKTVSPRRVRKVSTESRKNSGGSRVRKVSGTKKDKVRESNADDGDDEGYDDLLSAYESEEGSKTFTR